MNGRALAARGHEAFLPEHREMPRQVGLGEAEAFDELPDCAP